MIKPLTIPNAIGIYAFVNTINGKRYIGSSICIRKRIYVHLSMLRRQTHYTTHLQSAWDKYGCDAFFVTILENCDPEQLEDREEFFIQLYQTRNKEKGYNTAHPTRRMEGYKHSDATKEKMKLHLPSAWAASAAARTISVECVELGKTYPNAKTAAEELNLDRRCICRVCCGERKSTGGYTFRYVTSNTEDRSD